MRSPLSLHLSSATMLRISAEGVATALVLTVAARTGRAADAGFIQTAVTLPYVVSGPLIGNALDRTRRPRRLAVSLALCYAAATTLLFLIAGRSPLVLALLVAVVIGATEPIVVALTSLLPRFVPEGRLPRAYGLEASSYNLAAIAGPGLAAGLATVLTGAHAGIAVAVAAFTGLLALVFLPLPGPEGESGPSRAVVGGLMVLGANRMLRSLTVATTLAWLGFGAIAVTAVLMAEHVGAGAGAGGLLLAAVAVGSLGGTLASSRWLKARFAEWVMLAGLAAFGAALAATALAPSLPWAVVCFTAAGAAEGPAFAATLMLRQRESPPERLGQVNTTGGSLKIGASAIGAALAAVLADDLGADGLILGIAAFQFAGVLLGLVLLAGPRRGAP